MYDLVRAGVADIDGGMLSPLLDMLSGCAYLHARSPPIVHRDLKPPNVLHDASKRCKLCDFGTALELHAHTPKPTEWVGSALYVAPEIDRSEPYGLPADVFSFGVLAYELCAVPLLPLYRPWVCACASRSIARQSSTRLVNHD